jgi:hypothetical protein
MAAYRGLFEFSRCNDLTIQRLTDYLAAANVI